MNRCKHIFLYLFVLLVFTIADARTSNWEKLSFHHINTTKGLPDNWVRDIYKDSRGFIWFVTWQGLSRYDGNIVKRYGSGAKSDVQNLKYLRRIAEDINGNLWIGTEGSGLFKFDVINDCFEHYAVGNEFFNLSSNYIIDIFPGNDGLLYIANYEGLDILDVKTFQSEFVAPSINGVADDNKVNCIYIDRKDVIWMGTENGLYSYDPEINVRHHYLNIPDDPSSIPGNAISAIYEDEMGNLWIGTRYTGLCMLKKPGSRFLRFDKSFGHDTSLPDQTILCLEGDQRGTLFVGTENGGLSVVNIHTYDIVNHAENYARDNGLKDKSIHAVYFDNEGILWLGTYNSGINYSYPEPIYFDHYKYSPIGLNNPNVLAIARDHKGNYWIGTDGNGVNVLDPETGKFTYPFSNKNNSYNLSESAVKFIVHDPSGSVWMGIYGKGLFRYYVSTGEVIPVYLISHDISGKRNDVMNITISPDGEILFATQSELYIIDKRNNSFSPYITDAEPVRDFLVYCSPAWDSKGNLWIGHGGGILVVDPKTRKAENIDKVWSQQGSIKNRSVSGVFFDSKDNLWLTPNNRGLARYDASTGTFIEYNEDDGLLSNEITNIFDDENGNLWLTSSQGISIFENAVYLPAKASFINFQMTINTFSPGSLLKIEPNKFAIGGNNGLLLVDISTNFTTNKFVPPVFVTRFQLLNQTVTPGQQNSALTQSIEITDEIRLKYFQNSFSFDFAALSYREPSRNKYRVYLENFDEKDNWIEKKDIHSVSYANISPGTYRFHVQASNNNGLWNEKSKTILIIIDPPFYKSWWAFILYFTVIALLFGFLYRFVKIHYQLKLERVEKSKIKELDTLKTNFVTNISHEFRTPLTLILDPLENIIANDKVPQSTLEKLTLVRKNAWRLRRMTNQLLDYQRVLVGKDALSLHRGDLNAFVEGVVHSFKLRIEKKHQIMTLHTDDLLSDVFFDADKLEKILYNLLSNACKFTDTQGRIDIRIQKAGEAKMEIIVSDTGIGISQEDKQKIFNRFYRIERNSDQKVEGTGIGLALTRELVKVYGGDISVESEEGVGSTFIVTLPVIAEDALTVTSNYNPEEKETCTDAKPESQIANAAPQRSTLLIVEDIDDLRTYIANELDNDYNVKQASDGQEGKAQAKKYLPDLILSDIMMPEMDGVEMCIQLKNNTETSHIPILLLTAKTEQKQQLEGIKAGAVDYITKPFSMQLLKEKIKNILHTRQALIEKYQYEIITAPVCTPLPDSEKKFLEQVISVMDKNLTDPNFNLSLVSENLGMSKSSFFRKLKAISGKSPVEFLQAYKMEKALILIRAGNLNISEIAFDTGFSYPSYFTLSFKKHFGKSPSDYMKNIHSKD